MRTKSRKPHFSHPHAKAERALTAAVLLALLSGTTAAPALAKEVKIAADETVDVTKDANGTTDHEACLTYDADAIDTDAYKTSSPSGNKLIILGKVTFAGYGKDAANKTYVADVTPAIDFQNLVHKQ